MGHLLFLAFVWYFSAMVMAMALFIPSQADSITTFILARLTHKTTQGEHKALLIIVIMALLVLYIRILETCAGAVGINL